MTIRKEPQPAKDRKPRCGLCRFYEDLEDQTYCRRYPPVGEEWQTVMPEDWCGEYRPAIHEKHLSIADAGRLYFGLSVNGSYLAAKRGDLPLITVGRRKRVPVAVMELRMAHARGELEMEKEE